MSQWVWNLRLEVGREIEPTPLRTTEFAPAIPAHRERNATRPASSTPASGYAFPAPAISWKAGRFTGSDFPLQPDGTLLCPAGQKLVVQERHREVDGSLRVVYGASIRSCRPCSLRAQCQWNGAATAKPRQVSVLLHPLPVGSVPLLWHDWSRKTHRRACMHLLRHQRMEVNLSPPTAAPLPITVWSCPALSERTRVSRGLSGSFEMDAPKPLAKLRSDCLGFLQPLLPRSVWRQRK